MLPVTLHVSDHARWTDVGDWDRGLRHTAARGLHRLDATDHRFERVGPAARKGDIAEAMHHRVCRHDRIIVDRDRSGGRRNDVGVVGVVGAFDDVADQVVGVGQGAFDVVVAPAGSIEAALDANERGQGRSSTEIVPVESRVTSRWRSHSGRGSG